MPPPAGWRATPCRHGVGRDGVPLLLVLLVILPTLLPSSAAHRSASPTPNHSALTYGWRCPPEDRSVRSPAAQRRGRLASARNWSVRLCRCATAGGSTGSTGCGRQRGTKSRSPTRLPYDLILTITEEGNSKTYIPSSFSIRLVDDPDSAEDSGSKNRRLLNTEKIIFKAESSDPVYVLVTVEPEGVVAKPNVPERELALFNIVCDELVLGVPHFALWVGIGALLCIVLALVAPLVLPLHKLLDYEPTELSRADTAKMS